MSKSFPSCLARMTTWVISGPRGLRPAVRPEQVFTANGSMKGDGKDNQQ